MRILSIFKNTSVPNENSKRKFGSIIEKEFTRNPDETIKEDLLCLAMKYNVPQLNNMLDLWKKI